MQAFWNFLVFVRNRPRTRDKYCIFRRNRDPKPSINSGHTALATSFRASGRKPISKDSGNGGYVPESSSSVGGGAANEEGHVRTSLTVAQANSAWAVSLRQLFVEDSEADLEDPERCEVPSRSPLADDNFQTNVTHSPALPDTGTSTRTERVNFECRMDGEGYMIYSPRSRDDGDILAANKEEGDQSSGIQPPPPCSMAETEEKEEGTLDESPQRRWHPAHRAPSSGENDEEEGEESQRDDRRSECSTTASEAKHDIGEDSRAKHLQQPPIPGAEESSSSEDVLLSTIRLPAISRILSNWDPSLHRS
jgi:hypothetical protein